MNLEIKSFAHIQFLIRIQHLFKFFIVLNKQVNQIFLVCCVKLCRFRLSVKVVFMGNWIVAGWWSCFGLKSYKHRTFRSLTNFWFCPVITALLRWNQTFKVLIIELCLARVSSRMQFCRFTAFFIGFKIGKIYYTLRRVGELLRCYFKTVDWLILYWFLSETKVIFIVFAYQSSLWRNQIINNLISLSVLLLLKRTYQKYTGIISFNLLLALRIP